MALEEQTVVYYKLIASGNDRVILSRLETQIFGAENKETCAISREAHKLTSPIKLLCEHSVCFKCVDNDMKLIECVKCGFFSNVAKVAKAMLTRAKDTIETKERIRAEKFEQAEQKINTRVQNLKYQIDQLANKLKESIKTWKSFYEEVERHDADFFNNLTTDYLYHDMPYMNMIKNSYKVIERKGNLIYPEMFISPRLLSETMIGELKMFNKNFVVDLLNFGLQYPVDKELKPVDIFVLRNEHLIIIERDRLTLVDSDFIYVRELHSLNDIPLNISGIALDDEEKRLYLSDFKNIIFMTDLDLRYIKHFDREFCSYYDFHYLSSVCFKNSLLFVCDVNANRIDIFNRSLTSLRFIQIDNPWKVKVSDTMLCVLSDKKLSFYDLERFLLAKTVRTDICNISEINSQFYCINSETKLVECYDGDGELKEVLYLQGFVREALKKQNHVRCCDGIFVQMKEKLLMISCVLKRIVVFHANSELVNNLKATSTYRPRIRPEQRSC